MDNPIGCLMGKTMSEIGVIPTHCLERVYGGNGVGGMGRWLYVPLALGHMGSTGIYVHNEFYGGQHIYLSSAVTNTECCFLIYILSIILPVLYVLREEKESHYYFPCFDSGLLFLSTFPYYKWVITNGYFLQV